MITKIVGHKIIDKIMHSNKKIVDDIKSPACNDENVAFYVLGTQSFSIYLEHKYLRSRLNLCFCHMEGTNVSQQSLISSWKFRSA